MTGHPFVESDVEEAALEWFAELGYEVLPGPRLAPGEPDAERESYGDVVLAGRLRNALVRINPRIPRSALDDAFRKIIRPASPALLANNHAFHRLLVEGVTVEYQRPDGSIAGDTVRVLADDPAANDWLVVNQLTVKDVGTPRKPDIVVYVNGLPLGVIELKNPLDPQTDIWHAFQQFQTYKHDIPALFSFNEALVISDGVGARIGTLTADPERFSPWRTIAGEDLAPASLPELQVLLFGVFEKRRFLDLIRHFIVFEEDERGQVAKKLAGYHQFHAVNRAVACTVAAAGPDGDRRVGVVWHTQGSGKSLTMAFYAGRIIRRPTLENPTLVVLTDRNDLDDQLFGIFARCHELLRQTPVQARDREHLKHLLQVAAGGVIFTTVQKFFPDEKYGRFPLLSDRRNIIVIADEAHRSQYDFIDGFARHLRDALPNASFIGFTGTPLELTDKNTQAVFGDYISIYDIQRAVEDGATVPIYYESRLAKLDLDARERPRLDADFEEVTEGEELEKKERLKSKWAALEAIVGSEKRIDLITRDLVAHFDERQAALDGKAMVVGMSRRICVELYNALVRLRPEWHAEADGEGVIKVVMTGSASDALDWQRHIRPKKARETLASRFKNPADPLKIVIVRDMWLTGFDAPCLHTMYLDKPMGGHNLMQAIARVNRVFKDKPGGLVVDYLGLADQLKQALATYTQSGGQGRTAIDQNEAVAVMLEKSEICRDLFHGFDWSVWLTGTATQRLGLLKEAAEHILSLPEGQKRLARAVDDLAKAFALAIPHDEALRIREEVGFFQHVRTVLPKTEPDRQHSADALDHAVRQLVSKAVAPGEVIDIFAAAGLQKPDISILSDEFLAEVRDLPQRNLAVELLRKLLSDEIRTRSKTNVVQSRSFAELLERAMGKYNSRTIETAAIIEELIALAKQIQADQERGQALGLSPDEIAFYDALATNDSAVQVLGDAELRLIARELVVTIKRNVTIDWTVRESVRAKLRGAVKRILRHHGYPPDLQEQATKTVLEQAEVLSAAWAGPCPPWRALSIV